MNNSYKKAMDKIELSYELKEKIINSASKPQAKQNSKFKPVFIRGIAGLAACFIFCFLSYYAVINYYMHPSAPELSPKNEVLSEQVAMNAPAQEKSVLNAADDGMIESSIINQPDIEKENKIKTEDDLPAGGNGAPLFAKAKVVTEDSNDKLVSEGLTIEQAEAKLGYEIKSPKKAPAEYKLSNISVVRENVVEITYKSVNDTITYAATKASENLSQKNNAYEFMEIVNVNNTDIVLKGNEELYYNAVWSNEDEYFLIESDNGVEKNIMIDIILSVDYTDNEI